MADEIKKDNVDYRDSTTFDDTKLNSISEISKAIRHKMYGVDTREAIAQQGEALIKLMQETGGNQSAEVQAARGNFDLLGMREDAQDNAINTKFGKNDADKYLKSIAAVPETFTNLDAIKAKYPSGKNGLMVAADNGHKYIWNGSSWSDAGVYQAIGLSNGSVTSPKIDKNLRENFVDQESSIFNTVQVGGVDDVPFGRQFSNTATLSNAITCVAGETWSVSLTDPSSIVYFYNELDEPLSVITKYTALKNEPFTFTIPEIEGLHHFRVNMRTSIIPIDEYLIVKGDNISLGMKANLDWLEVSDNNITDKGITTKKIEGHVPAPELENLFDVETADNSSLIDQSGLVFSNKIHPNYSLSDYIRVAPNRKYELNSTIISGGAWLSEYDVNKTHIKHTNGITTPLPSYFVTTQPDTAFIRVNIDTSKISLNDFYIKSIPKYEGVTVETYDWLENRLGLLSPNDITVSGRFKNKNLLVTGDSITEKNFRADKNWHDYLKNWLGLGSVYNDGKSGSGLVKNTGIVYRLPNWESNYGTESDVDMILLMGNMNDGTSDVTGDWNWLYGDNDVHKGDFTTVITDTNKADSMWYALRYTIETIIEKYPNTPFGYITSQPRSMTAVKTGIPREGYDTSCWGRTSWFDEWVDAIFEVCGHYSVPVLDLYHESNLRPWNDENKLKYFSSSQDPLGDGTHPNSLGQELMAHKIMEFVKQYM